MSYYERSRRFPHDRAQPLGSDMRVARCRCETLLAQQRLHVRAGWLRAR
jgi:hypothetical protein